jgi:hypothetical protein
VLVTKDGKTKAGRNKAEPPGYFPPKTLCAALILEAWRFIHGFAPAPKNQTAAAAAELYWNVSIGRVSIEPAKAALERIVDQEPKSWGDRLNGWRHHLKQAKDHSMHFICITLTQRSGAELSQQISRSGLEVAVLGDGPSAITSHPNAASAQRQCTAILEVSEVCPWFRDAGPGEEAVPVFL